MEQDVDLMVGDSARVKATFTDPETGVTKDPTLIYAWAQSPSGVVTPYTLGDGFLERLSIGVYRVTVDLTEAGDWGVLVKGTGDAKGVEETTITVRPTRVRTP